MQPLRRTDVRGRGSMLLYLDDELVAIDKPSGLLVHRGWGRDEVTAMHLARDLAGRHVFPVHRLDRATSGVLVFALGSEVAALLQARFEAGEADKRYLALTRGVTREVFTIDNPVRREETGPRVEAQTEFVRRWTDGRYSLVEARPLTGRLHQIRRHLKHDAHPIVGDVNYGKGDINRFFREHYDLHRLALHATSLTLPHPRTGALLRLEAAVPDDLAVPLLRLGVPEELWKGRC